MGRFLARRPLAQTGCYLERYLPVASFIFFALHPVRNWRRFWASGRGVWLSLGWWELTAAASAFLVVVTHVGVMRRWHPLIRITLYMAWLA